jgi:hypothetical protein
VAFSVESDLKRSKGVNIDFSKDSAQPFVFYQFKLDEEIDLDKTSFSVCLS